MARASLPECRAVFFEKFMLQYKLPRLLLLAVLHGCLSLSPICFAQSDSTAPKHWAVVIGISKYPKLSDNQQLLYADRDAQAFAEAIRKISGDNVRLLVNQQATSEAIKEAIGNWLASSTNESDTVTIYFSGHGIAETAYGEAYLLTFDSDARNPYASGLSLRELSYALTRRVKANRILIIADAVRREFFDAEIVGDTPSKIFSTSFNQLSQWRSGIATILANSPGEYSREGQKWDSHGVFSKFLIDAINSGLDLNNDKTSDAEEIFSSLWARVSKETSKKQYPSKSGTMLSQIKLASRLAVSSNVASLPAASQNSTNPVAPAPIQPGSNGAKAVEPPVAAISNQPTTAAGAQAKAPVGQVKAESTSPKPLTITPSIATAPSSGRTEPVKSNAPPVNRTEVVRAAPPKTGPAGQPATKPPQPAASQPKATNPASSTVVATTSTTTPVKPMPSPPPVVTLPANTTSPSTERVTASIPVTNSPPAPSPLVLELESALAAGRLVEPKGNCAWDTYQAMTQQPELTADAVRFRGRLAEALFNNGKTIISTDLRSDNIVDKVDDFKRAGQMLARARQLTPEKSEINTLEKLSAAAALISLQFFDEAEKALLQLPKMAATENALGIVFAGKLDNWKAERAFKNAVEMDSQAAAPHYNLGLLYRAQRNEAALAEFEKAAELDARNYAVFLAIGDEYFSQSKWQQASEGYRKAIALRPYDDNLYTKLGHALYSQGQRDEANKAYQKAKEIRSKQ
jgi:uncharacterized caspase-like protein/tetratricopeptide (TPR) repeat protein